MKNKALRILTLAIIISMFAACSSITKHNRTSTAANTSSEEAYASGIGAGQQTEFGDMANNKAPDNLVHHYYFDFDKDIVQQKNVDSINEQSAYLVTHPNVKIRLEGNTDERGSREYNIALGWRRAKAVARIMEQQGVSPKQIIMVSYGEEKPVAFGHDEASYRLNRKVDLIYKVK